MVLFVHRPEYYHILEDDKGNDLRGMAQIIIAKHRKGATGDVLLNFEGQYTRFSDPEKSSPMVEPMDAGDMDGEFKMSKVGGAPMGENPFSGMPPIDPDQGSPF